MPMKRELYPADWPDISRRIRDRAGQRCEECGVPNYADIVRDGDAWEMFDADRVARRHPYPRVTHIVLTVHHRDADPSNNQDDNLVALCQRCHFAADMDLHKRNAAETRRRRRLEAGQKELLP